MVGMAAGLAPSRHPAGAVAAAFRRKRDAAEAFPACANRLSQQIMFRSLQPLRPVLLGAAVLAACSGQADLVHRYSFTADATDSAGDAHGVLRGSAYVNDGAVVLDGASAYVDLPNGLLMTLDDITVETWLVDNGSGAWSRIFDFGNSSNGEDVPGTGLQYLFLTPRSGASTLRGAITLASNGGEQIVEWPGTALPTGVLTHVAWAADSATHTGRLYVDGALVGENPNMTLRPSDMGHTVNNWIGRSQWNGDAYLNAAITEFRIHSAALTADAVRRSYELGPDVAEMAGPVTITEHPQSLTVVELDPAVFRVAYRGSQPVSVQWYRGGMPIPGATNDTCTLPAAALSDHGTAFTARLANVHLGQTHTATSSAALLSVFPDSTPPVLVEATGLFPDRVLVRFSEGIRADTATNHANYAISCSGGALEVVAAALGSDASNVVLTTAAQELSAVYTLTVNHLRDRASAGNLIAANSQALFMAAPYLPATIGDPSFAGSLTPLPGGYDVSAGGQGIGGPSDQCSFHYQTLSGDFDTQVRVASIQFSGAWARAGVMARPTLATNAPFAASFATPGPAGCHFQSRASAGAKAAIAGAFPVNYPDTWLRLRRQGNVFDGFASLDGLSWEYLGSATIAMSSDVLVGLAVAAGADTARTLAQFRDAGVGHGTVVTNAALPFEPMGPSSRRTPLAITEIMYRPPDAWAGTDDLEYIELWNSGLVTEDLSGHRLTGEIEFRFPSGTTIAPGQFLVVAADPAAALAHYGVTCLGPYTNRLGNDAGVLCLLNELGGCLLKIEYASREPWPVTPDGTGHSLVLTRPSYGENDARAWSGSDTVGGSPGRVEHFGSEPARPVVINELLAHSADPQPDFIELFNPGRQAADLSGAWLSDTASLPKFRIPDGTVLDAGGFRAFDQTELGFALAAEGETVFLVNSNRTRVLDAVRYPGQALDTPVGRHPDGTAGFQPLAALTPGAANAVPVLEPLVINEIMYHPISEDPDDEYVEIHNRSLETVPLDGWRLEDGIDFAFPADAAIPAGGYAVVARNATHLLARHPHLNASNTFGNYAGSLRDSGDCVTLARPETQVSTNAYGVVRTNTWYVPANRVAYLDGGQWGQWSDGGGSSIELIDPRADNRIAANWADSDESAKAGWTMIDITNVMENGQSAALVNEGSNSQGTANRFEIFLQGAGEALLDNVEFRSNGGGNLIANGTFESGATGWTLGGVLRGSTAATGVGVGNSQALHLVSVDRGDTGPNKVCVTLTATAATGPPNTGTIRAAVRWLKGSPYVLLRVRGNWIEAARRLDVPEACGTPGLPNSRRVANAGPTIVGVAHAPVLPAAHQAVVVSARIEDVDGVGSAAVRYRVDPGTPDTTVGMNDQGLNGDARAGDGLYSATLPGQPAGTLVAFRITANDAASPPATRTFPDASRGECLVRWGESAIAGSIGTYRLWVTSSNLTFWAGREKNANDPVDATFVYGNSRAVYNVGTLYSGSPFHTPNYDGPLGSMACDYEVNFPTDDRLLGAEPFVLTAYDVTSANFFFNDDSAQVDLTGTWIGRKLGQPYNYRRHVHLLMNGARRGTIYDDAQQPNRDLLDQYFPDDADRELRKVESWFEFANDAQTQGSTYATIARVDTSAGEIDTKRYRWNWRPRATTHPDDWTAFTSLVAVVNDMTSPHYETRLRTWMDVPNFFRPVAVHHICGSWDSYAYERGKNMYAYRSQNRPWRLLMWDIELAIGAGGNVPTDSIYNMFDQVFYNMVTSTPGLHREYLAAFQEALDTALAPGAADALLDERYASFQQNNVPLISPAFIKTWLAQRRAYLLSQIPTAAFAITSPASQTVSGANLVTLNGTGPLTLSAIRVNDLPYPIAWLTVTSWTLPVPLTNGVNRLVLEGKDRLGAPIAGAAGTVVVNYTGATVAPEGYVVINEIGFEPARPGAGFVELLNTHSYCTFDLSDWRLNGVDFTFPQGSLLAPGGFLVLAEDPAQFGIAHGLTHPVFGRYDGRLDRDGETLTLFRPGLGADADAIVVDRVRYEPTAPWTPAADGISLQLVDAEQDNSRVANWAARAPVTNVVTLTPQWVYVTQTATVNRDGTRFYLYLESAGEIYIDDLMLVAGSTPGTGVNLLKNGNFESALAGTWSLSADFANSTLSTAVKHTGNSSLRLVATAGGSGQNDAVYQTPSATLRAGSTYTLSFWYRQNTTGTPLVARLNNASAWAGLYVSVDPRFTPGTVTHVLPGLTPGAPNSVATNLPAFPPLWLNEVQADNTNGPLDNAGQREPWTELYNPALTNISLAGYYLTDTYTNLAKWAFPADASIAAGGFATVWCDNQTEQAASNSLHASFRLAPAYGSIALTRMAGGSMQVVDYLNYTALPANSSYGAVPDGQPFYRRHLFFPTPGATNNGAAAPVTIFINEWLADNASTLADPADGDFEDWIELYNPGPDAVDLGGCYLTDTLTNWFQFRIPATGHYVVPPGGYLLVWADNESDQNSANRADLHVDFALGKGGEAIGLFAADGAALDAITFGRQTTDVSQGRCPDGTAHICAMPTPTPRAPNLLCNTPPVLAALDNRVLFLGQTLSFVASATDDDQPPQQLTFSLLDAPAGAQINPTNGVFAWTPTPALGTYSIVVAVTDDGTPNLSATRSCRVTLLLPPEIGGFVVTATSFSFHWSTAPGQQFVVDFKTALDQPDWTPLSGVLTATGDVLTFTSPLDDAPQRFFRVRVLP